MVRPFGIRLGATLRVFTFRTLAPFCATRAVGNPRFIEVGRRAGDTPAVIRRFRLDAFAAEQLLGRPFDARAATSLFERVAPEPVPEREGGHTLNVRRRDRRPSF
jgi:hypothetical protein